jgi:8-oxo-dGTP pyrophosphatase MutT (NUDIX family)
MLHAALAERLAAGAASVVPHDGDAQWRTLSGEREVPAAVLVPFVERPHPTVLLTRRQDHLRRHSGQVAFPGGRADPDDADLIATALREAAEEVALPVDAARVVGLAPPYRTVTGYVVTPVLAVIPPDLPLLPHPDEVAHLFEVRCDHLFDPAMQRRQTVDWQGSTRHYWEIAFDDERIWGATAGMIRNIGALLGLDMNPRALNRKAAA